jgi:hypothetical protein
MYLPVHDVRAKVAESQKAWRRHIQAAGDRNPPAAWASMTAGQRKAGHPPPMAGCAGDLRSRLQKYATAELAASTELRIRICIPAGP